MGTFFDSLKQFGYYKIFILLIISLSSNLVALTTYATVFTAAEPKLSCKHTENDTIIPNTCEIWLELSGNSSLNNSYECVYSHSLYGLTIVNELDLICDKFYLVSLSQTMFMVGSLFTFFGGWFSDRYGRRKVCFKQISSNLKLFLKIFLLKVSLAAAVLLSLSIILPEILMQTLQLNYMFKYVLFAASQFGCGFFSYLLYVTSYILLIEITSPEYHTLVSNFNLYMYVVGEVLLCGVAYFLQNWHFINIFIAAFSIVIIVLITMFLPESPSFLIANDRYPEAESVLKLLNQSQQLPVIDKVSEQATSDSSIIEYLLNPKRNMLKIFLLCYIWISLSMIYYGVGLGIESHFNNFN